MDNPVRSPGDRALRFIVLGTGLVAVVIPMLFLLSSSLRSTGDFFTPRLIPNHLTLENFRATLQGGGPALTALENSLVVTSITTAISVSLGTLTAFALARLHYRWVAVVTVAILAVRFYPKISTTIPYYVIIRNVGLLDTQLAVIIAHVSITLPIVVLIMSTFFRGLPRSLEEAATIDGATLVQVFRHIAIPMSMPGIATSAILVAMISWNEFLIASSVTSDKAKTLPVLISSFITDKGTNLGQVSAVTLLVIIPIALFVLLAQRYLVRGLTLGAVKE
jgi:multiple sugar transport system permease protein